MDDLYQTFLQGVPHIDPNKPDEDEDEEDDDDFVPVQPAPCVSAAPFPVSRLPSSLPHALLFRTMHSTVHTLRTPACILPVPSCRFFESLNFADEAVPACAVPLHCTATIAG